MKRRAIFLLRLLCLVALAAPASADPDAPGAPAAGKLRWNNGETLGGELFEANATELTWKTPAFEDPLVLRWTALRRFDQPLAPAPVTDPFSFDMQDGSHLYGELVAVSADTVTIRSTRHGETVLKRAAVLRARRLRGGSLLTAGPNGDVGWSLLAERSKPDEVRTDADGPPPAVPPLLPGPGGALLMPYWNKGAFLDVKLPEASDVEFRVRSTAARPDFQLSLEGTSKQRLRIETWDDDLVLWAGNDFKSIRKLDDNQREVALRVCWDRKSRRCVIYTPAGEQLAEWQAPAESGGSRPGLALVNKGRDLALETLRVRPWDGNPLAKVDLAQPRVELSDGRVLEGTVGAGPADAMGFRVRGQEADTSLALGNVDAIIFSAAAPAAAETTPTAGQAGARKPSDDEAPTANLVYADGTYLVGKIDGIKDGRVSLKTVFTDQPLTSSLETLRQLLIKPPATADLAATPLDALDKISVQRTTLHGRLAGSADGALRWMPVGGAKSVAPSRLLASEITRAIPPGAALAAAPALFYTAAGDVLPGKLVALDRSGAELESSTVEIKKLPAELLTAIQFGGPARGDVRGFREEAGWRVLKGDKDLLRNAKDASLTLTPNSVICQPQAMQSNAVSFKFNTGNFVALRLRLFSAGTDGGHATNLILFRMSNRLTVGLEGPENQIEDQIQTMVGSNPAAIRLGITDKGVEISVNGAQVQTYPMDPAKRAGSGLIIEPAGMWGNTVEPVTLSDFASVSTPGQVWLQDINADAKAQALTVPRFRKEDLPRHAILAPNGDVLRGEIEAVTVNFLDFRSGLENLHVPRDRVKAAVWLKKPAADAAAAPADLSPTRKLLEQKLDERVRYGGIGFRYFIDLLKREVPGLKVKLPEKEDRRRLQVQIGGMTIGETLDKVCPQFGLRYRIDAAGTIVFESAGEQTTDGMTTKVYWLKAGLFPASGAAQDALAAKGVNFPEGASAVWEPNAGQLSVTNTAANHRKLAGVIAKDFGGGLGSPTHWLVLTNGARLGLIVEKFEPDAVVGRHPVYGRCRAPMAEIYAIRSSPLEPTASIKSLQDWQLAFAPEPVLPETGGESSALLGKEAGGFKLALLGGGNFDLKQEKGKVIVLDFWATWCGPCIKSLPGLIEAMSAFPADKVKLIGVNQGEPAPLVKSFLETRGWQLNVALDTAQAVGKQYGVEGIPHTVIVGPDGKVARVKTGYTPDGDTEIANAVKQLLTGGAPKAPAAEDKEAAP